MGRKFGSAKRAEFGGESEPFYVRLPVGMREDMHQLAASHEMTLNALVVEVFQRLLDRREKGQV